METVLSVLVVDDEQSIRNIFSDIVAKKVEGVLIHTAADGVEGLQKITANLYDIAFIDVKMPRMGGLELLEHAKKIRPEMEVIIFTAQARIEDAVRAIKMGASDYVAKPFRLAEILLCLEKIRKVRGLKDENKQLKEQLQDRFSVNNMVGMTSQMERVNELIDKVRVGDMAVLITGESGTGKELVARAIHYNGKRRDKPFLPIDCASIHKNLLESELFGHEKGAFTGAVSKKIGLFEKASGGTLFLDEIAEIPLELQPSLLRSLEEKKIRPVGGTNFVDVDVRIISATNRDLLDMVEKGEFRRDLFYRLNVVMINVPPLRERKDDIPLLVEYFIEKNNGRGIARGSDVAGTKSPSKFRGEFPSVTGSAESSEKPPFKGDPPLSTPHSQPSTHFKGEAVSADRGKFKGEIPLPTSSSQLSPLNSQLSTLPSQLVPGRVVKGITQEALYALLRYDWPGNVRELEHTIEHAFALGRGDLIGVADIPASIIKFVEEKSNRAITIPANKRLGEIEKDLIVKTLIECKGDTAKASELLGIDRSTIYRKLKRNGIDLDDIRNSKRLFTAF